MPPATRRGPQRGKISDQDGGSPACCADEVHGQHGTALTEAQIGQAMCGMILARSGEGKQSTS